MSEKVHLIGEYRVDDPMSDVTRYVSYCAQLYRLESKQFTTEADHITCKTCLWKLLRMRARNE